MSVGDALADLPLGVQVRAAIASATIATVAVLLLSIEQLVAYSTVAVIVAIAVREWWRGGGE
jgi:hypothetical protein